MMADLRSRRRAIVRRECADKRRRARLERDPARWRKWYCHDPGAKPDGLSHRKIIAGVQSAVKNRTGVAVAAPRGDGKTTTLANMAWYLVCRRVVRFPVMVRYTHTHARRTFRDTWLKMLSGALGRRMQEDYPELTQPFEVSTNPKALERLTWDDTGEAIGATVDSASLLIVLPDGMGAIACVSAKADVKGLQAVMPDGTVLRPDLLLIDDAQDVKRASNPAAVADQVDILENVFLGMAGPQTPLMTFVACTVEDEGDVSCHWLNRDGFESVRVPRILRWPGGGEGGDWPMDHSDAQRMLWDEWWRVWKDEGSEAKNRYYRKNRSAMIAGMEVSWKHRRAKMGLPVDEYDSAMHDYYDSGPFVFSRAQQNMPVKPGVSIYTLTPEVVCSRATSARPWDAPAWSKMIVATTDVNPSYGLTWGVTCFGADQTAAVIGYGIEPMRIPAEIPPAVMARKVYESLCALARKLLALPCVPEAWIFDARGWHMDTAIKFGVESARACGMKATPAIGFGARQYRPYHKTRIGAPREQCHMSADQRGKWLAWNADYWKECAQKAWTGSPGAPGACSLPIGNHREFAEQICREQLVDKGEMGGEMRWEWNTLPGPHDFNDVMAMAYMAAAYSGIGVVGGEAITRTATKRRIRHVKV